MKTGGGTPKNVQIVTVKIPAYVKQHSQQEALHNSVNISNVLSTFRCRHSAGK